MSAARDRRARRRDDDKAQRQVRRWDRLRARAHMRPHAREQRVKALPVQASPKRHEAGVTANVLVGEPDWDRRAGCRPGDKFGHRLVTGLRRRNRRFFHCPAILSKSRSLCPRHRYGQAGVVMRQRQSRVDAPHESHFVPAPQLMFPNPQSAPAAGAEGAGDEAVAGAIGGNLWSFAPSGRPPTATPALRRGATPAS